MSRKKRAPKRKFYPDSKYGSTTLSKFINFVMYDGRKLINFIQIQSMDLQLFLNLLIL